MKQLVKKFNHFVLDNSGNLTQKTLRAGFWAASLRIISRLLTLIISIFLARILTPEDFGLFRTVILVSAFFEAFSHLGLNEALIQKKGKITSYLDTVWTIEVVKGAMIFLFLLITAPIMARFFNAPRLVTPIRIVGLGMLLKGFSNISLVCLTRKLDFKKKFLYQLSSASSDVISSLILSLLFKDYRGLVWAILVGRLVGLIVSHLIAPKPISFGFNQRKFGKLFTKGKFVFLQGVLLYFVANLDSGFVSKNLGQEQLGYYQMGYKFSGLILFELGQMVTEVSFPAYTKVKTDLLRIKRAFFKVFTVVLLITLPMMIAILIGGQFFVKVILGAKWLPSLPVLKILVLYGFIKSLESTILPLFKAVGRFDLVFKIALVNILILILLLYPLGLNNSIVEISWAMVLSSLCSLLLSLTILIKRLKLTIQ